jgi:hypothetical protein
VTRDEKDKEMIPGAFQKSKSQAPMSKWPNPKKGMTCAFVWVIWSLEFGACFLHEVQTEPLAVEKGE